MIVAAGGFCDRRRSGGKRSNRSNRRGVQGPPLSLLLDMLALALGQRWGCRLWLRCLGRRLLSRGRLLLFLVSGRCRSAGVAVAGLR
eukprot:11537753-Alexandrium_andersonii.AAC.1